MKIISIILAIGTAVIVGGLVNLGIRAFHPEPQAPDYGAIVKPAAPYPAYPCDKTDKQCIATENARIDAQQKQQEEYQSRRTDYENEMKIYNRDVFLIANLAGIAVFIAGFLILFNAAIVSQGVPIGVMMAGMYGIIYGYARGWGSANDQLKFFVGLVVALLVIGGSVWLTQRYAKKRKT